MSEGDLAARLAEAATMAQDRSTVGEGLVQISLAPLGFMVEATRVVDGKPRRARHIIGYGEAIQANVDLFGPSIDRVLRSLA